MQHREKQENSTISVVKIPEFYQNLRKVTLHAAIGIILALESDPSRGENLRNQQSLMFKNSSCTDESYYGDATFLRIPFPTANQVIVKDLLSLSKFSLILKIFASNILYHNPF